jgi:hypothetical protein
MKMIGINPKTGITMDYMNEYCPHITLFGIGDRKLIGYFLKKKSIQKYEERYSPEIYEDVITLQNQFRVVRLNQLAEIVNVNFQTLENFDDEIFKSIVNEVGTIVYGKKIQFF